MTAAKNHLELCSDGKEVGEVGGVLLLLCHEAREQRPTLHAEQHPLLLVCERNPPQTLRELFTRYARVADHSEREALTAHARRTGS